MNKQEKIKAKIEQNVTDQHKLIVEQARLQSALANLQEPQYEPKHGDVIDDVLYLKAAPWIGEEEPYFLNTVASPTGLLCNIPAEEKINESVDFNVFDNIRRNKEDLEEFTFSGGFVPGFQAKITCDRLINILSSTDSEGSGLNFFLSEAIEIHQKLGQTIATLKRKQNE